MSYKALRIRVQAAEREFAERVGLVETNWDTLRRVTRASMTPARLIGSGFITGVVIGFTEPLAKLGGGARLLQLATTLIGFVGAIEAKAAAEDATDAAETATVVAADPGVAQATLVESKAARIAGAESEAQSRSAA